MLGSAFFPDTGLKATVYYPDGTVKEGQEVRSALWVDVLKIVGGDVLAKEGRSLPRDNGIRAKKPVVELKLSYATDEKGIHSEIDNAEAENSRVEEVDTADSDVDVDDGNENKKEEKGTTLTTSKLATIVPTDISPSTTPASAVLRSVLALLATEFLALIAHYVCLFLILSKTSSSSSGSSFFNSPAQAIWFLLPLTLKFLASTYQVRRIPLSPTSGNPINSTPKIIARIHNPHSPFLLLPPPLRPRNPHKPIPPPLHPPSPQQQLVRPYPRKNLHVLRRFIRTHLSTQRRAVHVLQQ